MSDKVVTLKLPSSFAQLVEAVHRQHKISLNVINEPCLTLDPGETTGWASFNGDVHITVGQEPTKSVTEGYTWLRGELQSGPIPPYDYNAQDWKSFDYKHIRCEDYRVYEWKASDHAWSPVHTIRFLGAIEVAAYEENIPLSYCMAQHAKAWWTDEKLKHFGLYTPGLKHGRDALRHLLYYLLFPTKVN